MIMIMFGMIMPRQRESVSVGGQGAVLTRWLAPLQK